MARSSAPVKRAGRQPAAMQLPELLFPQTDRTERRKLAVLVAEKQVKRIAPRLYIRSDIEDVSATIRRNWSSVLSALFPDSLLSHRSALEYQPTERGEIFVTARGNRTVKYPGLRIVFKRGPQPLVDDPGFMAIRASSLPRALLENLSISRGVEKNVDVAQVERRLEQILRDGGERELDALRDRARQIAHELHWELELERLEAIIDPLLAARSSVPSDARALSEPFDERCLERLQILLAELRGRKVTVAESRGFGEHFRNKAFFEAYFSNYIEGTTFELDEAERIVFDRKVPAHRPVDAHVMQSTFDIVSGPNEMRRTPESFESLRGLLEARHAKLMAARPQVLPGTFKQTNNRIGSTLFVHPDQVVGTLRRGFDLYRDLEPGFARAVFVMFLVLDVHPFVDGNGRIARIMMNAELVRASQATIIVPTVYRDEYIATLRALTKQHRPTPLVDMLSKAQRLSNLDFADYPATVQRLVGDNWFEEPGRFDLVFALATKR
jgi:hypothetical protein